MKTNIFLKIKYDLRGHKRSYKVILKFKNHPFLRYIFCLTPIFLKTILECQHYIKMQIFINVSKTSKIIQDHFCAKIIVAHSFMDQFWWKFVWMLNYEDKMSLLCYGEVLWFFTLRPSDLITTLTYVLI